MSTVAVAQKPGRSRHIAESATWLLLGATGVLGATAVAIGSHDLVSAWRGAERWAGAALALTGLIAIAATMSIVTGRRLPPEARRDRVGLALIGVMAGATPGILLLSIQFGSYGYDGRVVIWAAAAAIPLLTAVMLFRLGARPRFVGGSALTSTLLAALIGLLPAALGVAFRPVSQPAILDLEMTAKVVAHRTDPRAGRVAVVDVAITTKNISNRRLLVVGSLYSISGARSTARVNGTEKEWSMADELQTNAWSARYESPWNLDVTEVGYDFYSPGDILEPGQHDVENIVTVVPESRYNSIDAYATIATVFADRVRLGQQERHVDDRTITADQPVEATWPLEPTGWLSWMTLGHQALRVAYGMDEFRSTFSGLYLEVGLGRDVQTLRLSNSYNERASTTAGVGWTTASKEAVIDGHDD